MPDATLLDELFSLDGRTAVVTGATRGLGRVAAETLARAGARVALCSRHANDAKDAAASIAAASGRACLGLGADASSAHDIDRLLQATRNTLGPIDILVANAGINIRKPSDALAEEEWDQIMDLNVKGVFLAARAVLPLMRERRWGRIVLLGSILSFIGLPGRAPYCASKAAVLGLVRALALESAHDGVCVNALCPGPFATPMNDVVRNDPEANAAFLRNLPVGRWGSPSEIRGLLLYLCSPAASFTTGASLLIDGAWTAQ